MKTNSSRLVAFSTTFAFALSIGVISCKKDKNETPKPLTATLNGSAFEPTLVIGTARSNEIYIQGSMVETKDSSQILINLPDTAQINTTYDFDHAGIYYYDYKKNVQYGPFSSSSHGTLTISTYDKTNKKIAGKFSGVIHAWSTSKDSLVITNGQFNTTYKQ